MIDTLATLIAGLSSNPNFFKHPDEFDNVQVNVKRITRIATQQLRYIVMMDAGLDIDTELIQERQDVFDCWCEDHKAHGGRMSFRQFEVGYQMRNDIMARPELSDSQTERLNQLERSLFPGEYQ